MTATATPTDKGVGLTLVFGVLTVLSALAATTISFQAATTASAEAAAGSQALTGAAIALAMIFGSLAVAAPHIWE